jgi:hypothetical protein
VHHGLRHVQGAIEHLGDPEVANLDVVVACEEDVHALDVAMKDIPRVDVVEPQRGLDKVLPDKLLVQQRLGAPDSPQLVVEVSAFSKLRYNV